MLCMMVCATVMFAGCNKDENNEPTAAANGGGSNGGNDTGEGIYLGIIGFNDQLYIKDISKLNQSTVSGFTGFINGLTPGNGTGLYYADYTALQKMQSCAKPPKLKNVALVTFTDGLDNVSLANDALNPENYNSTAEYREALHNKIVNDQVHGFNISAYTIGLKGNDVTDNAMFMETLKKLASSDNNVFQVANMDEAMQRFREIAENLYSVSTSVNLGVNVPGGYDDGQVLRFTFDNASSATGSSRYIEATYRRSNGRTLESISYHGLAQGATSISSSSSQGTYYQFLFEDLKYTDGTSISQGDINNIMLWKRTSTGGWDRESEFDPASSSNITEDKSSALIMLVLDCTNSLGNDFGNMQQSARNFVYTLANSNGGDNPTPNPGGGENPNNLPTTLYEDFNSNSWLTTWSGYDADGDGYGWRWVNGTYGVNNTGCASSSSWFQDENGNNVALNADNYMITPELYIPSDGRTLSYQVTNAQGNYPDAYSVLVLTESTGYSISQGQIIQPLETVSTEQPEYTSRGISLNAFKGKSIKIAFQHKDYDKVAILVDNIMVQ